MSNTKCCTNGDVRGMCFICIGNLEDMTAETIIRVRKCPNRDYAIAYWIENNHGCEKYYERYGIWADEFQENEYLALLNPNWSWINDAIYEIEQEHDEDDEEEEKEEITDDNIITGIICKKCNTELPPHIVAQHLDVSHPIHICPHTH